MRLSVMTLLACLALLAPVPGAAATDSICGAVYTGSETGVYNGMCAEGSDEPYCILLDVGTGGVRSDGWCLQALYWALWEAIQDALQARSPVDGAGLPVVVGGHVLP